MSPQTDTPGRSALKTWLSAQERGAQEKLSRSLGVTTQLVTQWVSGQCRPSQIAREGLGKLVGIPVEDWDTAEDKKKRELVANLPSAAEEEPAPEASPKNGTEG